MTGREKGQLYLAMHNLLVAIEKDLSNEEIPAVQSGLRECVAIANQLFSENEKSLTSFTGRIQEISRALRMGERDQAKITAKEVRRKLQRICEKYANEGNLDEVAKELRKSREGMTRLDFYVAELCKKTYRNGKTVKETIMSGMPTILKFALAGKFRETESVRSLLMEKIGQSSESADDVRGCAKLVRDISSPDTWAKLEQQAQRKSVTRLVRLVNWLVKAVETKYPRPEYRDLPGHYAILACCVFTAGLIISANHPQLAQELLHDTGDA